MQNEHYLNGLSRDLQKIKLADSEEAEELDQNIRKQKERYIEMVEEVKKDHEIYEHKLVFFEKLLLIK